MPVCDHCGSYVSERLVRVFVDKNGQVLACPNCLTSAGIAGVA